MGCECTFSKQSPAGQHLVREKKIHRGRGRREITGKIGKNTVCKVEALACTPALDATAELTPTLQISREGKLAIYLQSAFVRVLGKVTARRDSNLGQLQRGRGTKPLSVRRICSTLDMTSGLELTSALCSESCPKGKKSCRVRHVYK